jgi:hypothetical protein
MTHKTRLNHNERKSSVFLRERDICATLLLLLLLLLYKCLFKELSSQYVSSTNS